MKYKLLFVVGLTVGYVLGARAGRERYEQLKEKANDAWEDPRVQHAVSDAQEFVKENAPLVQARVVAGTKAAVVGVHDGYAKAAETAKDVSARAANTAKDVTGKVLETAQELRDRASDRGEEVVDSVFVAVARARDRALEEDAEDGHEENTSVN